MSLLLECYIKPVLFPFIISFLVLAFYFRAYIYLITPKTKNSRLELIQKSKYVNKIH